MQSHNIFVHPCSNSKCRGIGQMLHARHCVLCDHENLFYDPEINVDPAYNNIAQDMLTKLHLFKSNGGEAPSFGTVSPRQKDPEIIKPLS